MADQPTPTPADQPAPAAAPDVNVIGATVAHNDMGGSFYSLSARVDAAGTQFVAVANEQLSNSNITWCELYVAPAGQGLVQQYRINPVNKIDRVAIENSGHNLVVYLVTHSTSPLYPPGTPRPICIEQAIIPNIFASTPDFQAERGGAGVTIVPADPIPTPDVDYTRIQTIVETVVGATEANSLVKQITTGAAGVSVRTALREIAKQALVYLADPANYNDPHDPTHLARQYQDLTFNAQKNAAANPLANVLGGQDAWGQARKAELVAIVHEGSHQP